MEIQYNIVTWHPDTPVPSVEKFPQSWQQHLAHHKQEDKRQQAMFAYALLYQLVGAWLGYAPELEVGATGKPCFVDCDLHFSLSHTQGGALAAVSRQAVGVDIEKIRPLSQRTMQRIAHTADAETFFNQWVRREAVGKCIGTGITMTGQVASVPEDISVEWLDVPEGYVAALAQK